VADLVIRMTKLLKKLRRMMFTLNVISLDKTFSTEGVLMDLAYNV
jgi:hypothetical protein